MKPVRLVKMCSDETYSPHRKKIVWCISFSQWFEEWRCFIATAFQLIYHQKGPM